MISTLLGWMGLSGWDIAFLLFVIVLLFYAQRHREEIRNTIFEAFTSKRRTYEVRRSDLRTESERPQKFSVALWIAEGFGIGRVPYAPGTAGSLLGLVWFALVLLTGRVPTFQMGILGGIAMSIWLCGRAEKQLQRKDPGSVVLDEIVAIPICFTGWLGVYFEKHQALPALDYFFRSDTWLLTAGTFVLFRVFDILKPWPLRQSQSLPGGWGVTVDDLLAAVYTAIITGFLAAKLLT